MVRWLIAVGMVAAGCGDNQPGTDAPDTSFEFHATAGWSSMYTPNVTSVTIGGTPVASGGSYEINVVFASYDEALATFQPVPVVITTTVDQQAFTIAPGQCKKLMYQCSPPAEHPDACLQPITHEDEQFFVDAQPGGASVNFGADCGSCTYGNELQTLWCARPGSAR